MAKLSATTYERPAATERVNPFIEVVKQFTDQGIDTAFKVEFEARDYKAEKLQIQKAVNAHGFSAREVETTWDGDAEYTGDEGISSTFLVRPPRKRKGDAE